MRTRITRYIFPITTRFKVVNVANRITHNLLRYIFVCVCSKCACVLWRHVNTKHFTNADHVASLCETSLAWCASLTDHIPVAHTRFNTTRMAKRLIHSNIHVFCIPNTRRSHVRPFWAHSAERQRGKWFPQRMCVCVCPINGIRVFAFVQIEKSKKYPTCEESQRESERERETNTELRQWTCHSHHLATIIICDICEVRRGVRYRFACDLKRHKQKYWPHRNGKRDQAHQQKTVQGIWTHLHITHQCPHMLAICGIIHTFWPHM